jgi:hypothetical protein
MNNWGNRGTSAFINSVRSIIKERSEELRSRIAHGIELSANRSPSFDKRSRSGNDQPIISPPRTRSQGCTLKEGLPRGGDSSTMRSVGTKSRTLLSQLEIAIA